MEFTDDDRDAQAQRLEQMRNDFRVAQQRRRDRGQTVAAPRDDTGDQADVAAPPPSTLGHVVHLP